MPRVVAEGDCSTVVFADTPLGAEDEYLGAGELCRLPAHANVLGPAKQIATRAITEHIFGEREFATRTGGFGDDVKQGWGATY